MPQFFGYNNDRNEMKSKGNMFNLLMLQYDNLQITAHQGKKEVNSKTARLGCGGVGLSASVLTLAFPGQVVESKEPCDYLTLKRKGDTDADLRCNASMFIPKGPR